MSQPLVSNPTQALIARRAGVSVATVSKVLNGRSDVSASTKERVERMAENVGYRKPPGYARSTPAKIVSLMAGPLSALEVGQLVQETEKAMSRWGYNIVLSVNSDDSSGCLSDKHLTDELIRSAAGVLCCFVDMGPTEVSRLADNGVPCMCIVGDGGAAPGLLAVNAQFQSAGYAVTEHLLGLGHRRIALLGAGRHHASSRSWLEGHHVAMDASGVSPVREYAEIAGSPRLDAFEKASRLLSLPMPPTAFVACTDTVALEVYRALVERGLRVPQDVSVAGLGDLDVSVRTSLTGVRQSFTDLAAVAAGALVAEIEGGDGRRRAGCSLDMPTDLVVRTSTGPPPSGRRGENP